MERGEGGGELGEALARLIEGFEIGGGEGSHCGGVYEVWGGVEGVVVC